MKYFSPDFNQFFKELAANNHKDWFDINRKRYEKEIKDPFKAFVTDLIERIRTHEPSIQIEAKDAIFRINKDIRFSKDKTPYKLHMGAVVSPLGRKDRTNPGIYVQLGPEDVRVYGGIYTADKEQLQKVRTAIASDLKGFQKAISAPSFVETYGGEIHGEKNKVLPKELKEAAQEQPIIFNKNFYYFTKMDADMVESDQLLDIVMKHYEAAKPVREFLRNALQ